MDSDLQSHRPNGRSISFIELVRGILHDARDLSVKEFTAAKLEILEEIARAVRCSIFLGIGLFALATGIVFLSVVLALVLARYLELPIWMTVGGVGSAHTILGLIILFVAQRQMKETKALPHDTLRSAREDAHYVREKAMGH